MRRLWLIFGAVAICEIVSGLAGHVDAHEAAVLGEISWVSIVTAAILDALEAISSISLYFFEGVLAGIPPRCRIGGNMSLQPSLNFRMLGIAC